MSDTPEGPKPPQKDRKLRALPTLPPDKKAFIDRVPLRRPQDYEEDIRGLEADISEVEKRATPDNEDAILELAILRDALKGTRGLLKSAQESQPKLSIVDNPKEDE